MGFVENDRKRLNESPIAVAESRVATDESRIPTPEPRLIDLICERSPLTVAAFMELALYHPALGYYARAARRSGRAGDFFTSVDVGPLFGELLEVQIAEMAALLWPERSASAPQHPIDVVEAGAGDGRLSADILRAARKRHPALYEAVRLHLVESSAAARAAQPDTLFDARDRLLSSAAMLPDTFEGVLIANELLDALPTHQVAMRESGLREIYIAHQSQAGSRQWSRGSRLTTIEGPLSMPELRDYLARVQAVLEPGWRTEVNLAAIDWIRDAARRLTRGFMILIDYGHEARELYSPAHSAGTLTSFSGHRSGGADVSSDALPWLAEPGERDITAHVDFTSVRAAAEAEGMTTIALLDQTYFLMGLLPGLENPESAIRHPQWRTLIVPGGLGSTMKVLILGKGVGTPPLKGCSFSRRAT